MSSNDETTADEPQRIDLTQFDGNNLDEVTLTEKAAYDAEYEELTKNMGPGIPANIPDGIVFAPPPPGELAQVEWLGHRTGWIQIEDARAIAAVPELLAELKRTYDKIDVLEERLQFSEHIMETMHDEHYADLVMDFIEQAHPSKWCDWGHCRECQRLNNK